MSDSHDTPTEGAVNPSPEPATAGNKSHKATVRDRITRLKAQHQIQMQELDREAQNWRQKAESLETELKGYRAVDAENRKRVFQAKLTEAATGLQMPVHEDALDLFTEAMQARLSLDDAGELRAAEGEASDVLREFLSKNLYLVKPRHEAAGAGSRSRDPLPPPAKPGQPTETVMGREVPVYTREQRMDLLSELHRSRRR